MNLAEIDELSVELPEVRDYYSGLCLPERFALPDNILVFRSDRLPGVRMQMHSRYGLTVPLAPMRYCLDSEFIDLEPGLALLARPYQYRCVMENPRGRYDRLLISFDLASESETIRNVIVGRLAETAERRVKSVLGHYRDGAAFECAAALYGLLRELSGQAVGGGRRKLSERCAMTISYINHHLEQPFGLPEVADAVGCSESHLRSCFRAELGVGLGEYVARLRFEEAKSRLRDGDWPVERIARSCGYTTLCAFSHFFRRRAGMSPLRYRRGGRPSGIGENASSGGVR